jgi:hypothetical protein
MSQGIGSSNHGRGLEIGRRGDSSRGKRWRTRLVVVAPWSSGELAVLGLWGTKLGSVSFDDTALTRRARPTNL